MVGGRGGTDLKKAIIYTIAGLVLLGTGALGGYIAGEPKRTDHQRQVIEARHQADQLVADAEKKAGVIRQKAEKEADQLIKEAKKQAKKEKEAAKPPQNSVQKDNTKEQIDAIIARDEDNILKGKMKELLDQMYGITGVYTCNVKDGVVTVSTGSYHMNPTEEDKMQMEYDFRLIVNRALNNGGKRVVVTFTTNKGNIVMKAP